MASVNSSKKAVINYYARLILKKVYTIEKVPKHLRQAVQAAMESERKYLEELNSKTDN